MASDRPTLTLDDLVAFDLWTRPWSNAGSAAHCADLTSASTRPTGLVAEHRYRPGTAIAYAGASSRSGDPALRARRRAEALRVHLTAARPIPRRQPTWWPV